MEVGHAARNVYLQAVSLGLETVVVGAFDDDGVGGWCRCRMMSGWCALCLWGGGELYGRVRRGMGEWSRSCILLYFKK